MSHPKNVLISNATLVGLMEKPFLFKKGKALSVVESLEQAYLLIQNGLIADFGPQSQMPDTDAKIIDATGKYVLPGWVDSHTHIVFAKSREEEYVSRIKGKSYEQIAEEGGGILNSARKLQAESEESLFQSALERLNEVISYGTTTIEIKSGYGLTVDSELKMLRVIKRLKEDTAVNIKATFLGAHAVPTEYKADRQGYISLIINEMLPKIVAEGLADYCDVFCDKGFYTVAETDQILEAASKHGLKAKIHANELGITGGVQVGIKNNAISVDHLEQISDVEIAALLESNTIPTLLPGTSFFLNLPYAPARKMIDDGLGVVLASDYNPGSTPAGNMVFTQSLACLKMKMTPEEAFNATTINAAHALELSDTVGSISIGKRADLIITKDIPSLAFMSYAYGKNHIEQVLINGKPTLSNYQ